HVLALRVLLGELAELHLQEPALHGVLHEILVCLRNVVGGLRRGGGKHGRPQRGGAGERTQDEKGPDHERSFLLSAPGPSRATARACVHTGSRGSGQGLNGRRARDERGYTLHRSASARFSAIPIPSPPRSGRSRPLSAFAAPSRS